MLEKRNWTFKDTPYRKSVTQYIEHDITPKARILYFHGGGLLYGLRNDLPDIHIDMLTHAGYEILAFDYPLAPAADLELILKDVCDSINWSCNSETQFTNSSLPYFLWGRSAGAYLCLLAASSGNLKQKPSGILSYYGYGFLCDNWFCTPSNHYLQFPPIDESIVHLAPQSIHTEGDLDTHYSVYVYARQTGNWNKLLYKGREKYFYLNYSLRTYNQLPCPLFAAHSTGDTDVPYAEFLALSTRYHAKRFIVPGKIHDFDRDSDNPFTKTLLEATLQFLDEHFNERS